MIGHSSGRQRIQRFLVDSHRAVPRRTKLQRPSPSESSLDSPLQATRLALPGRAGKKRSKLREKSYASVSRVAAAPFDFVNAEMAVVTPFIAHQRATTGTTVGIPEEHQKCAESEAA